MDYKKFKVKDGYVRYIFQNDGSRMYSLHDILYAVRNRSPSATTTLLSRLTKEVPALMHGRVQPVLLKGYSKATSMVNEENLYHILSYFRNDEKECMKKAIQRLKGNEYDFDITFSPNLVAWRHIFHPPQYDDWECWLVL